MASKVQFISIEEALIGTYYSSSVRQYNSGIIVHAESKDNYRNEYIVRVRPEHKGGIFDEFWATIAVG